MRTELARAQGSTCPPPGDTVAPACRMKLLAALAHSSCVGKTGLEFCNTTDGLVAYLRYTSAVHKRQAAFDAHRPYHCTAPGVDVVYSDTRPVGNPSTGNPFGPVRPLHRLRGIGERALDVHQPRAGQRRPAAAGAGAALPPFALSLAAGCRLLWWARSACRPSAGPANPIGGGLEPLPQRTQDRGAACCHRPSRDWDGHSRHARVRVGSTRPVSRGRRHNSTAAPMSCCIATVISI
jgi:hypothetical protein